MALVSQWFFIRCGKRRTVQKNEKPKHQRDSKPELQMLRHNLAHTVNQI